jgi:putative nucleotide binding protein
MKQKEDYAIVLDYLPHGYPLAKKIMPVAQAIGESTLVLLELAPRKGISLAPQERVYIGEGKRDKIYYILGRLHREKLTENAKINLEEFVKSVVKNREDEYVAFFNNAEALNTRLHQLELLPGFGKKHAKEIVEQRKEGEFKSFEDIKKRVPKLPDPQKAVEKRIMQELTQMERYNLFIR